MKSSFGEKTRIIYYKFVVHLSLVCKTSNMCSGDTIIAVPVACHKSRQSGPRPTVNISKTSCVSTSTAVCAGTQHLSKDQLCLGVSASHRETNVMYLMRLWRLLQRRLVQTVTCLNDTSIKISYSEVVDECV